MNTEITQEAIESGVDALTVKIPVRVTMTSYNNAPFEFTPSIDEIGDIVLTPISNDVEFTDVTINTDENVSEQEDIVSEEGNITIKETSIIINASMLTEVDNSNFSAVVDEIGQVIIYPNSDKNVFVTVSFDESLNLITEDTQTVEYFGYRFINNGDGWDVYDYLNELIEEGVATLAEAKILACTTEIHRLEQLTEDIPSSKQEDDSSNETETDSDEGNSSEEETPKPEVDAEVIEEAVEDATVDTDKFNRVESEKAIKTITSDYSEENGVVSCDTVAEKNECEQLLRNHYSEVTVDKDDDKWIISYSGVISAPQEDEHDD